MTGDVPTPDVTPGTLVGVGVGPGDPELVTRLAVRRLEEADRIVAPTTAPDAVGRAEAIVRQVLPQARIDRVHFDMSADRAPGGRDARAASHTAAARCLVPWLEAGETVAFVTLGDPNIYSTFPSLAAAVSALIDGLLVETVPGIMAFQALAARSATVLLDGTESLALVTALDGTDHVAEALRDPDRAVVIYKGGRHLPAVTALLAEHGRLEASVFGELLGLPGERIVPVATAGVQPATYLATVVVPPAGRAPASAHQGAGAWTAGP